MIVWPGPFRTRHLSFASEPGRRGSRVNSRHSPLGFSRHSQPPPSRLSPLCRVNSLSPLAFTRSRRAHGLAAVISLHPAHPRKEPIPTRRGLDPPRRRRRVAGTTSAPLRRRQAVPERFADVRFAASPTGTTSTAPTPFNPFLVCSSSTVLGRSITTPAVLCSSFWQRSTDPTKAALGHCCWFPFAQFGLTQDLSFCGGGVGGRR